MSGKRKLLFKNYFKNIYNTVFSILEGMAVTLSYMFRRPITIQYPYKLEEDLSANLPERFRGILEVDMDYCIACLLCARACPIECIAIDVEKNPETKERFMTRFDIEIGKCMFCGLCVEVCSTGAIHHSNRFDGTSQYYENLTVRFITDPVKPFKKPKDQDEFPIKNDGSILKERMKSFFDLPDFRIDVYKVGITREKEAEKV